MSMTDEEFYEKERVIEETAQNEKRKLIREFAHSRRKFIDGEIITFGDGSLIIQIDGINISRLHGSIPYLSYKGKRLTKQLKNRKNEEISYISFESARKFL